MVVVAGLWVTLRVGPAVGAPAGEDAAAMVGCHGCKVLASEVIVLPFSGVAYQKVKMLDPMTGLPRIACIVEDGFLADEESLLTAEREVRWQAIGAMDPALADVVAHLNEDTWLPVFVWGKVDLPDPDGDWLAQSDLNRQVWGLLVEELTAKSRAAVKAVLESHGIGVDYELEGAPVVHALARASDLWAIAKADAIASIDLDVGPGVPTSANWVYAVEAGLPHVWGIDGTGERIALQLVEKPPAADYTTKVVIQGTANPNGTTSTRSTWAMGAIRSRPGVIPGLPDSDQGIAPNSLDYMANSDGYQGFVEVWAYNQGAKALVYAMGSSLADRATATNHDKYVDYYTRTYRVLVVASAGNRDVTGGSCSQTYSYVQNKFLNGLIVGGVNDQDTRSRLDDAIYDCSSYTNPTFPWWPTEVPHVVAPAKGGSEDLDAGGYQYEGTSASAVIVGGIVSLVQDKNNSFRYAPEGVRAVVMATAWENVDGTRLNLTDGVDDKDGVGEVSAARAVMLADSNNKKDGGQAASAKGFDYGTMSFPGNFTNNWYDEAYNISLPPYSALQAVLAWSATSTCTNYQQRADCGTVTPDNDLDLYLFEGGTERATSVSYHNAYEYIYYYNSTGRRRNLTLKVYWSSGTASSAFFGIAWDTLAPTSCPDTELCGPAEDYDEVATPVEDPNKGVQAPAVTRLGTGEWVVAWPTSDGCTNQFKILAQLLDRDGAKVGTPFVVQDCSPSSSEERQLRIAPMEDDRFVVAWHRNVTGNPSNYDIEARVYLGEKGSQAWSPIFRPSVASDGHQMAPGLTTKGDEFWVVWRDIPNDRIVGRLCYDVNPGWQTSSCANEVVISQSGIGADYWTYGHTTAAATLGSDRFVVVWTKYSGGQEKLVGRVVYWSGSSFATSEFDVSAWGFQIYPDAASLGNTFVVSWRDGGVKAKVMNDSGVEICHVHDANSRTYGYTEGYYPQVAGYDSGSFRVAFYTDQNGAYWRKYTTSPDGSGHCAPPSPGDIETRVDDESTNDLDKQPDLFVSACCPTTAILAWSADCMDPGAQDGCINHRILAW